MQESLRELGLTLATYSLAPCWNDELPYYGLFVERGDFAHPADATRLAESLERRLCQINSEYESKRSSLRLGPVQVEFVPDGAWQRWDRQRLLARGGTPEQYKHPCLISDPDFRRTILHPMPVAQPA
jgi:hypothetical protein